MVEDYAKKIKTNKASRQGNEKQFKAHVKEIGDMRAKLGKTNEQLRKLVVEMKGLSAHAGDLYKEWLALANQIAALQKEAKGKKGGDDSKIKDLHAQAEAVKVNWNKAIGDANDASHKISDFKSKINAL